MKSPFPGMDPWLEAHWRDVHQSLVLYSRDQMQAQLPADLRARVEERVFVEMEDGASRSIYPDVFVVERSGWNERGGGVAVAGGATTAQPILFEIGPDPATEGYVEIREAGRGGRVITVIEFLSPTNKVPGPGREFYIQKIEELSAGGVNVVEIDLIRDGEWMFKYPLKALPPHRRTPYAACVRRASRPTLGELYPLAMRAPLPIIPIPLRPADADARLDLQALIELCYRNGAYDDLDYASPPEPLLTGEDAAWADEVLRAAGKRA